MELQLRPTLIVIAAVARNGAIGRNNQLLMHLPGDLPRFKRLTEGHTVLMGRKTWDSIGRPLPGRRNIVITRDDGWQHAGAERASSLANAVQLAHGSAKAFVIGGGEIYAQAVRIADGLVLTEIDAELAGDTFFPEWDRSLFEAAELKQRQTADGVSYRFVTYNKK